MPSQKFLSTTSLTHLYVVLLPSLRYFSDSPQTVLPATASTLPGRRRGLTSSLTLTLTRQIFNKTLICETTQKLLPGISESDIEFMNMI